MSVFLFLFGFLNFVLFFFFSSFLKLETLNLMNKLELEHGYLYHCQLVLDQQNQFRPSTSCLEICDEGTTADFVMR